LAHLAAARLNTPQKQFEVLVAINGYDPDALRILEDPNLNQILSLRVFEFGLPLSPAEARNRLVEKASGEWLYFLDDDAFVDSEILKNFEKVLRDFPTSSIVGGPNLTPPGSTEFEHLSGFALASRFGSSASFITNSLHIKKRLLRCLRKKKKNPKKILNS
jgi:glycosyltransferase involved in cell wall biosynthesis